jgi:hypothetical protein
MSLFRNESPNLGPNTTCNWLSGSDVLVARDFYAIPQAFPHEQIFGKPPISSTVIDPNTQRSYAIVAPVATTFTLGAPSLGPLVSGPGAGPLSDGKVLIFKSFTNFAHIISAPGLILNGTTSTPLDFIQFPPFAGAAVELTAYQGFWLVNNFSPTGNGGVVIGAGSPGAPQLGFASTYAIGARATETDAGTSSVTGNAYLSPGTSFSGNTTVSGRTDINNANSTQAEAAVQAAYLYLASQTTTNTLPGSLNGVTITPGVWTVATTSGTTGAANVNFDAQGNPNAIFILQIGTALTFGSGTTITLLNGAVAKNIFWQVGTSATFAGTGVVSFKGNLLAAVSISMGTAGGTVGRLFAGSNGDATGALTFAGTNTVVLP